VRRRRPAAVGVIAVLTDPEIDVVASASGSPEIEVGLKSDFSLKIPITKNVRQQFKQHIYRYAEPNGASRCV
jgi:hypothetical protein